VPLELSKQNAGRSLIRRATKDERGVVFVEFIICFTPMFVFFLGITQLAFSYATKIVVQHAASKAVRAAMVSEPEVKRDCPNGDPGDDRDAVGFKSLQDPFSDEPSSNGSSQGEPTNSGDSPLLTKVRAAAYLPLAAMGPPVAAYPVGAGPLGSIAEGLGQYTTRFATAYFIYNRSHAAVTFRDSEGKVMDPQPRELPEGRVTIQVSYLHYCMIPLVSRIMCNPIHDLAGLSREIGPGMAAVQNVGGLDLESVIQSKGANLQQALDNVESASDRIQKKIEYAKHVYGELMNAEYPQFLVAWALGSGSFQLIESHASMPFQHATYVSLCQTKAE
jgi:TadE-like protein